MILDPHYYSFILYYPYLGIIEEKENNKIFINIYKIGEEKKGNLLDNYSNLHFWVVEETGGSLLSIALLSTVN